MIASSFDVLDELKSTASAGTAQTRRPHLAPGPRQPVHLPKAPLSPTQPPDLPPALAESLAEVSGVTAVIAFRPGRQSHAEA